MPTVLEFAPDLLAWLKTKPTFTECIKNHMYDLGFLRLYNNNKVGDFNKSLWNFHIYLNSPTQPGDFANVIKQQLSDDVDQYFLDKKLIIDHWSAATNEYHIITPWMIHHRAFHFLSVIESRLHNHELGGVYTIFDVKDSFLHRLILDCKSSRPGAYLPSINDLTAEYFASYCCHGIKFKTAQQTIEYIDYLSANDDISCGFIDKSADFYKIKKISRPCAYYGLMTFAIQNHKEELINILQQPNIEQHIEILRSYYVHRMELFLKIKLLMQYFVKFQPDLIDLKKYFNNIIVDCLDKHRNREFYWSKDHIEYQIYNHTYTYTNWWCKDKDIEKLPQRFFEQFNEILQMINQNKTFELIKATDISVALTV